MAVNPGTTTVFLRDPNHSKSYVNFIRGIGEAKTKHEEDRIVTREAEYLKDKLALPELNTKERRECLIRMVYCEMLGHDMSHCYIHAVKFLQSQNIMDKRVGYLTVSLLLHENHELIMLLINTIQKDLRSANPMEVAMALTLICRLIGPEMIPPLLPSVQEKLMHPKELVRRKAVMVMHHFYQRSPSSVAHLEEDFRRMLGDTDPGVMEGTLVLFHQLVKDQPAKYKQLVPTFVNLLQSALGRRLPKEMEYHGVPAPWAQIRLLKILAILGADDPKTSEHIYGVLTEVISCAECNTSIGQAIMYEVIRTATLINFNSTLIDRVASNISRFLTSANNDWKYCGITALAMVAQVKPEVGQQYQMIVIDCLDDPDETLKKKTLDLLFQMTNTANVDIITERMLSFLRSTHEDFIKRDLVTKITQLAERFSPNNLWFLKTMNEVFEVGGGLVRKDVAHNLMRLIAEGSEDDDVDTALRRDAVLSYLELLQRPRLAEILVRQICWVVGEYSYVLEEEEEEDQEDVLERLAALLGCKHEHDDTNSWVITALSKIVARLGHFPDSVLNHIATFLANPNPDIQQRCIELCELSQNVEMMQEVLPVDASCEDLEVDPSLSFLDGFVADALQGGSQPYRPAHMRETTARKGGKGQDQLPGDAIKFEPYAPPPPRNVGSIVPTDSISSPAANMLPVVMETEETTPTDEGPDASTEMDVLPRTGIEVKKPVWGRGGLLRKGRGPSPVQLDLSSESRVGYTATAPSSNTGTDTDFSSGSGNLDTRTALSSAEASIAQQPTPEEQRKKELASALFGGLGGSGRAGPLSGPARPPKSKRKSTTPTTSALTPSTTAVQGGSPSHSPKLSKKVEVKKEDNVDLLLDLDFSGGGSVQEKATNGSAPLASLLQEPVSTSAQSGQEATDSLFSGLDNASSMQPVEQAPSGSLFSGLTESLEKPALPTSNVLEGLAPGIKLPPELEACPHTTCEERTQDGVVRVSTINVYRAGELSVVFYLTSMKQTALDLTVALTLPSNCQCSLDGTSVLNSTSVGVSLTPFGTCQKVVSLVPQQPALKMMIRCEVTYRQEGRKQFCDLTLQTSDMLRPWEIMTKEFGQKWGSLSHERRQKIQCDVKTPQEFHSVCKEKLNFHPVEIIRKEAIAAANFIPSTPVLIHGKVLSTTGMVEVWVKSTNGMLSEAVEKQLLAILKK